MSNFIRLKNICRNNESNNWDHLVYDYHFDKDADSGKYIGECKNLIETICKDIMESLGIEDNENHLPKRFNKVIKELEPTFNNESDDFTSHYKCFVQAICNARNTLDSGAHGLSKNEKELNKNNRIKNYIRDYYGFTTENISIFLIESFEDFKIINNRLKQIENQSLYFGKYDTKNIKAKYGGKGDNFTVLKNSKLVQRQTATSYNYSKETRSNLIDSNVNENDRLINDLEFSSPSSAAAFITGNSVSGPEYWVNEEGKTIKELGI
jgi:Domain of unknown function (DUF4357)